MMNETLGFHQIRSANRAREADEIKTETRRKSILILILHHLSNEGYIESSNALSKETNVDLQRYEVADNIDLETILMEYESYHFIKFNKYPKIVKKLAQSAEEKKTATKKTVSKLRREPLPNLNDYHSNTSNTRPKSNTRGTSHKSDVIKKDRQDGSHENDSRDALVLQGMVLQRNNYSDSSETLQNGVKDKQPFGQIIDIRGMINENTRLNFDEDVSPADRLMKPLGGYAGYSNEWRELAQVISRDIYSHNPNVKWSDIIGLENAKRLVKEAVMYPIKYPQLFKGILTPWKGLLLYGPPGTGKTLLAKAVATECKTTFFNISSSSIVSKWRGDSEKLVRVLFELARFHAPSTIFVDELESLMSSRGGGEHEGSRRMKTELLVQMDGLAKTEDLVFLLAASNLPWELDHAMLRRLEKRILVDLPACQDRMDMIKSHLPPIVNIDVNSGLSLNSNIDYELVAQKTEGYSGSDLKLVCKEAAMRPIRKIFDVLENGPEVDTLKLKLDGLTTNDMDIALKHTKPSGKTFETKYIAWQKEYESV